MATKRITPTEKAEAEFNEKLDGLDTQRERREVLESAAELIPDKDAARDLPKPDGTINGKTLAEIENAKPLQVEPRAWKSDVGAPTSVTEGAR